jgi:membrane protease YdiL (CAAX protease family)
MAGFNASASSYSELGLRGIFQRHPVASAVGVTVVYMILAALAGLVAPSLFPQADPSFIALIVMSVVIAVALTVLRWWQVAGFNGPSQWREARLIVLPLVVVIVLPLLGGVQALDGATVLYLIVAYLLTGFMEEGLMRGLVLGILRPSGVVRAIVVSSVLFALMHAGNVLYRSPGIVLAQMVGAFCDGFALAALRVRTNTLWFVIAIHALHDFFLRLSLFPTIPLNVAQDVILLLYGIYLIRNRRALEAAR